MIFLLAWRNIWRNKARSLVIMGSIALGLFAGIAVLSLYKGMMTSRIRTVIDEELGHLQLHHPQFGEDYEPIYAIPDAGAVARRLKVMPGVAMVVSRSVAQGMLSTPTGSSGVLIRGIMPAEENSFTFLEQKIVEGRYLSDKKDGEIIIGSKLADKMKLKSGRKIVLTFTDTANGIVSGAFRISGIYRSSNSALDERIVFIQKYELNALHEYEGAVQEIAVKLQHDGALDTMMTWVKNANPALLVESWKELSPETDFMVKAVDDYSYIIMIIIMVALAFGILNTMLMAVMERSRELGMMMALGTGRLRMFALVMTETIMLTLLGAPIGLLAAWLTVGYYHGAGLDLTGMGEDMMRSFGFSTMVYPTFPSDKLAAVMLIVTATALLSGIMPALKVLHMRPVDAIRN